MSTYGDSEGGSLFFDANFAILCNDDKSIAIGGMERVRLWGTVYAFPALPRDGLKVFSRRCRGRLSREA